MDFQITPIQNPNIEPLAQRSFWQINKVKIIIGSVIFLAAVAGVFYYLTRSSFSEGNVSLKVTSPAEITSGELLTYTISYENKNQVALTEVSLDFSYPSDAIPVKDGNIVGNTSEIISIGNLGIGEKGQKTFSAYIVGDKGNIKTARAILSFQAENISSRFEKDASTPSTITTLAIPLTLVAPPTIINGQTITYLLDYRNQSQQDYADLRLKLKYPDGFKFSSATPAPTSGSDTWDLATLKQGSGSRITIAGSISGNEKDSKVVSMTLQKKITTPSGDVYVNFEKTEAASVIATPYITVKVKLNDTVNYTAHLGEDLNYAIDFANTSNVDISGLNLTAKLEGPMFDLSTVRSSAFFDSRTNSLTWDQSSILELALLRPGQHGSANFSVKLKSSFSGGSGVAGSVVKASVHLETPNIPSDLDTEKLATDDQIVTRISSSPTLGQEIRINDPQFGSSGPFPPRVDSKTVFTVHWSLINPSGDVSPAKVTATLAPGVKWENMVRTTDSQPAPTYNSRTGIITWDVGTLPGGAGVTSAKYETYFQISITPSVNQVGQSLTLLKLIRFDGTDLYTKEKISRPAPDILTSSVIDSAESGSVKAK